MARRAITPFLQDLQKKYDGTNIYSKKSIKSVVRKSEKAPVSQVYAISIKIII